MLKTLLKTHALIIFTALLLTNASFAQDEGFVDADAHEHGVALMTLVVENDTLTMDFISPAINIVGFEYAPKTDEEKALVDQALIDLGNVDNLLSFSNGASCSMVSNNIASELSDADGHDDEHHEGEEEHHEGEDEHHDEDGEEEHHEGEEEHHEGEEEEHHDEDGEEHHEGEEEHHDEDGEEHHEGEEEEHHDEDGEEHHEGEEEHDEHGHEEEESVHSEFHASYTFTCNNVNRLAEIDLKGLFEQYPNVLDLDLQYVTEDTQGAAELNASQSVLKF